MTNRSLTAVTGIRVGHWSDVEAQTGCTVILCPEEGCVASCDIRGAAPGVRETALLEPEKTVERVHALLFSGGSAFGLAAATGVMRFLDERGVGFETPFGRVPIVPAAVIYDLNMGDARTRPGDAEGYAAAQAASGEPVPQGRVGAGAGASCGKLFGAARAKPSGLGGAALTLGGATLAALAVANPWGNVVDPASGALVAGNPPGAAPLWERASALIGNTTLVAVATDAPLSKAQCKALAASAQSGVAQATRPSHTVGDGDATFVLSTHRGPEVSLMALSVAVQALVAEAVVTAARAAQS